MFVRIKKRRNKKGFYEYAYLVRNVWTKKGARQRVTKYLGKVITIGENEEKINFELKDLLDNDLKGFIMNLFEIELMKMDFIEKEGVFKNNKLGLSINLKTLEFKTKSGKEFVLKSNEGFMCKDTIKDLLLFIDHYTKEEIKRISPANNEKGEFETRRELTKELASKMLESGLPANENYFIMMHEKLQKIMNEHKEKMKENTKEEEEDEFYY